MPPRSPIIFWLLLAATVCIDVLAWMAVEAPRGPYWAVVFDALVIGQLSVIGIWSALRLTKSVWTRILPWLAVILASAASGPFGGSPHVWNGLPYYGLHVALLLTALWPFERTSFWRRRTGSKSEWKYSLAQLLVAMTMVAVLGAAIRHHQLFDDPWPEIAIFICGNVVVAAASVVGWSLSRHALIRLAGGLGVALLLGLAVSLTFTALSAPGEIPPPIVVFIFSSHYLIQAVVLGVWIGIGPILPPAQKTAVADG